ncbi:DUF1700 domain-containing protein [Enterococcus villorum]|uniref:Membrane protein n=2 Tax=Enterococcus villorum TaxID=112904 RepID=A0A511J2P9_9ENTE|nr:DUF1700 domain-containing protein [Enterococcus villorum]EOH92095.1 membrane protein [Enterococcus villorum ATCC 700913]EOW76591.1 membrane protein [Enterococcus villorum ATCC 700913]GEL92278.1 membrane protein [Enterococcus villorum]
MIEYLDEVIEEMQEIPEADRYDLIQYYEEYFLDSGKTIDQIIEEYGTPKQFALKLKINYFSTIDDSAEDEVTPRSFKRKIRLIWMIVLGLCASPLLIPMAALFILAILGLVFLLIMAFVGVYVGCISVLGLGLFSIISGIGVIGQSISSGLFYIGMGLFATGSVLFFAPLLLKVTKWLSKMMMNFVKWVGRRFVTRRTIHSSNL